VPYEEHSRGTDLVADVLLTHGLPHEQNGLTGIVYKQDEPKSFDSLLSRTQVAIGVKYFLRTKGTCEIPEVGGVVVGDDLYINPATDAITAAPGAGLLPFGRVVAIENTFGTPNNKMRVDMDLKDNITVPV
jgi:hypothetical protein